MNNALNFLMNSKYQTPPPHPDPHKVLLFLFNQIMFDLIPSDANDPQGLMRR